MILGCVRNMQHDHRTQENIIFLTCRFLAVAPHDAVEDGVGDCGVNFWAWKAAPCQFYGSDVPRCLEQKNH